MHCDSLNENLIAFLIHVTFLTLTAGNERFVLSDTCELTPITMTGFKIGDYSHQYLRTRCLKYHTFISLEEWFPGDYISELPSPGTSLVRNSSRWVDQFDAPPISQWRWINEFPTTRYPLATALEVISPWTKCHPRHCTCEFSVGIYF